MKMSMVPFWNDPDSGKKKQTYSEVILLCVNFSTKNLAFAGPGSNPTLRGKDLATNKLNPGIGIE
jgi:hypothetical protein